MLSFQSCVLKFAHFSYFSMVYIIIEDEVYLEVMVLLGSGLCLRKKHLFRPGYEEHDWGVTLNIRITESVIIQNGE